MRSLNTSTHQRFRKTALSLAISLAISPIALANPIGPTVANGAASFATNGNTFTVTNSPGAIINWQQFNIGQNEITKFVQQNAQSAVLNRIGGQDPSQILGTLQSNGRVFLVNPNGVMFGSGAIIDVAGLIASSLNISNADFLADKLSFAGHGGSVSNLGKITTPVGGSVYLIGGNVSNEGIVTTPQGQVLLAAGNSVSLTDTGTPNMTVTLNATDNRAVNLGQITAQGGRIDIYGALIDQQGSLVADAAALDAQGRIVLKASGTTNVSGSISATHANSQGGSVQVLGDEVTLAAMASIDASGATGGGTVLVGGDRQGNNPAVQNATKTNIAAGANIKADATQAGNGGKVIVWSNDKTFYDGFISVRGGAQGGDGGFAETSGHTLMANGLVDARAPLGKNGTWLLDPALACISDGSSCTVPGLSAPIPATYSVSSLGQALALADVIVDVTDVAAYQTSSTYVLPAISGLGSGGRLLSLTSPYIYLNGSLDALTNNVTLNAKFDAWGSSASLPSKSGVIDIASGGHSLRTVGGVYFDADRTVNIAPDADFRANYISIYAKDYFSYSPAGGAAGFWGATSSTVYGSIHAPYVALGGTYNLPASQISGTGTYMIGISAYGGGSTGITSATYPTKSGVLELLPGMAWTLPNASGWKGELMLQGSQSLVLGAGAKVINGSPSTPTVIELDQQESIIELDAPLIVNNGASFEGQVVDVSLNSLSGSPISVNAYAVGLNPSFYSSSKNVLLGTDSCPGDWCLSDAGTYLSGSWTTLGVFSYLTYAANASATASNLEVVGSFNSRSTNLWLGAGGNVKISSPITQTGAIALLGGDEWGSAYTSSLQRGITINQPIKSDTGVLLATSGGTIQLNSTVTAPGVSIYLEPNCSDGSVNCASPVQASFVNNGGAQALQTTKGWFIENVAGAGTVSLGGLGGQGPVSRAETEAQGITPQTEAITASDTYYFAKGTGTTSTPSTPTETSGTSTADTVTTDVCVNNPALCSTTSSQMTSQSAQVVEAAVAEGTETKGVVTYDSKAAKEDKKTAKAEEAKKDDKGSAAKSATRPKDETKEADQRKSSAELKQESKQATVAAKKVEAEAKKTEAEAKRMEAEAKKAEGEAKKVEGEARKAEVVARKAEDDGKKAATEAKQAETEAKGAKNPEHKAVAESKKAEAESRKAEADAKQAEAGAKKSEVSAKRAEADAKHAEAEGKRVEASAKKSEADARKAEAEYKQAAAEAKEAKTPEQKIAAQKRAEEKRIESVQKQAEAKVKLAKAEERKSESEQKKVEASAHKVEAEAKQTEAEAKRDESSAHKAEAAAKQDESREVRAKTEGKAEDAKRAENRKVESEQKRSTEEKKAETKHAEAEGRKAEASKLKAEAETKRAEHAKKADAQRVETLKAFQKAAIASMTPERLAEMSALRHEFKTELLKPALTILQANPNVANLPACGGGSDVCMPARQEIAAQSAAQMPLPVPTLSFLPQIQRKVAVMVGINSYQDNRIPALESAVPDVEAVGKVLQEKMGYDVRVIRNGTRAEIVKTLNTLGKEMGANDSVTVYYAGHGYQMETAKGGNQGYWLPADASVSDPSNWVSNSDVAKLLGNIPAKQVMLVSDSCYSGAFTKEQKVAPSADAQQILSKRSVVVMSSGGEEPVSDEGNDGHSIFAWSLMNSLKNVGKFDSGTKVFEDTKASVIETFPQVPQYGAATSAGHTSGGDYLFEVRSFK
ncbi:caspase family protein [Denitratisoma oestradiolicum]|uniref:Caspase family p20 domain-containing protein n=1 Tax=Denitratisoma oestradiolicum TaxID=311182 RepID=A0A6S6XYM7_9PROT|nr:caspase family protein [Denitratisoma oestradiolicum]TWO79362.1 hypothetical protein CBW56_15160 [Denitratisoma oestradiolicum]CAB1367972.1 conserved exported protein of unknown function [Denitratisoma oestradiolicum]